MRTAHESAGWWKANHAPAGSLTHESSSRPSTVSTKHVEATCSVAKKHTSAKRCQSSVAPCLPASSHRAPCSHAPNRWPAAGTNRW